MNITVTLIAQIIAFVIMVWLVNKFLWGPVSSILEARRKKIAEGLSASERGKHELKLAEERATEILKESKEKAAEIVAQAQSRHNEILDEAKENARAEADRIIDAGRAEVEQELNRAKEDLRAQVARLSVTGAERVLKREVDAKAHESALDDLAAQI